MLKNRGEVPVLAGPFQDLHRRLFAAPAGEPARTLAAFAASLLEGEAFDLSRLDRLTEDADRALCVAVFDYCRGEGLTEEARRCASAALAPIIAMSATGTRH